MNRYKIPSSVVFSRHNLFRGAGDCHLHLSIVKKPVLAFASYYKFILVSRIIRDSLAPTL